MGKVKSSAYGQSFMADHYSARVNRYSEPYERPYSPKCLFIHLEVNRGATSRTWCNLRPIRSTTKI